MYQHFSTRKRFALRVVAYVLMTVAVIVGVSGAVVWILGYRFDIEENRVERSSLLQFQTLPAGAKIAVNDNELNFTTPGRYDNAKPGANTVKYWLDGYRDWVKTVNLRATEVRWLNYARLVPSDIETDKISKYTGYHQSQISPNGNWLLLHESPESRVFKMIDISDPQSVRVTDLTLPSEILPGDENAAESFEIIEWDTSSNFILLKRKVADQIEILRVDRREVKNSLNLTRDFNMSMVDPHFLNGDNNTVFALVGTDIRRFEIGSKSVSAPLVADVTSYDIYGDGKLSYVAKTKSDNKLVQEIGVYYRDKKYPVQIYDEERLTRVSFTHYYRTDYLAITRDNELLIIPRPLDDKSDDNVKDTVTIIMDQPTGWLTHNGSGRFIVAGHGEKVATYDLETMETFNFDLPGLSAKPKWIDDYHFGYIRDGKLLMTEFDGANSQTLVAAIDVGIFSGNNEFLFSFGQSDGGFELNRSAMVID